jgi:hypothetical protein
LPEKGRAKLGPEEAGRASLKTQPAEKKVHPLIRRDPKIDLLLEQTFLLRAGNGPKNFFSKVATVGSRKRRRFGRRL